MLGQQFVTLLLYLDDICIFAPDVSTMLDQMDWCHINSCKFLQVNGAMSCDQQFVTLLLYLDDICIFAPDISTMLDQMELVFSQFITFSLEVLKFL